MRLLPLLASLAVIAACAVQPAAVTSVVGPPIVSFEGAEAKNPGAIVAHGARLGEILGCSSCHGDQYQGGGYAQDADGGFIFASNLTREVPKLSDAQLRSLMTEGVHPRRDAMWYMPAKNLQRLSGPDLDALIAFLRTLEPGGEDWPLPTGGESTTALQQLGILKTSPDLVLEYRQAEPIDLGPELALGRYVASVSCAECHGPSLNGGDVQAPSLDVVAAYDAAAFKALLRDGTVNHARGEGLMALVARRSLWRLTDGEIAATYAYLTARASH